MKITIIGTGYVGLVAGTCFSDLGNDVLCLDVDETKISKLKEGIIPIYEPGLTELVIRNHKEGRLNFTTDKKEAIEFGDVIFIAVGTPMGENHEADLRFVRAVAEDIGKYASSYKVVVDKSTVPVGTADMVTEVIKSSGFTDFDVVSNPEFLKEGAAIKDFMIPDRVVIGTDSPKAEAIMKKLYSPLIRADKPLLTTDVKSAELIKYASNAMLATRISFVNELSALAEKVGADIKAVSRGMGLDDRIGPRFLHAGVGYGGSCFPKDVQALIQTMKKNDCECSLLEAVEDVNYRQKRSLLPKVEKLIGDFSGKTIGVWGLAFKPKTDDVREAPALYLIESLLGAGAKIKAFDPVAEENVKKIHPNIFYGENPYDVCSNVDCLVICTEWDEFRSIDLDKVKSLMSGVNIVDGRNIYTPAEMKEMGFNYIGVGRKS